MSVEENRMGSEAFRSIEEDVSRAALAAHFGKRKIWTLKKARAKYDKYIKYLSAENIHLISQLSRSIRVVQMCLLITGRRGSHSPIHTTTP